MSIRQLGKPVCIEGVRKAYGAAVALDGISLNIAPGEFCTLLGASGSGKTTLLKALAGFETCDAGTILVDGRDIGPVPVSRRNIGMVFQNYALFPHMTVARNVAFGLEMRGLSRAEIGRRLDGALALVSLEAYAERFPRELSGGQQQRVALARALVIEPDILLMDEPLGALDKNLRQSIQQQLRDLHQAIGATIIYVTHDQEEALFLSDRIALMDKGRIIQAGAPEDLYFNPANSFVAGFLGECNFIPAGDGRPGEVAVRPERTLLGDAAVTAEVRFGGQIRSVVFTGAGYRVIVDVAGRPVTALTDSDDKVTRLPPGSEVVVGYERRHAMTFSA